MLSRYELPNTGVVRPEGRTALTLGDHTVYLDGEQTHLLDAAIAERNALFDETINAVALTGAPEPNDLDAFTKSLKDQAITAFAEPSLTGFKVGESERQMLRAFQHVADQAVARAGEDPLRFQFLESVHGAVEAQQQLLVNHGIERGDTQYWHFTPRIRDLVASGVLTSGADPHVDNFTGAHSEGVHFVRPGQPYARWTDEWRNYAHHTHSAGSGEPIQGAFGAAVVLPLAKLAMATPLRNEQKCTDDTDEPYANDATFRTADGLALYSYSIGGAYIMPTRSEAQKVGQEGALDQHEALSRICIAAGYDSMWTASQIVRTDTARLRPGLIDHGEDITQAYAHIAQRTQHKYVDTVVVPLTSTPGRLEKLDGSPDPRVERLLVVKTDALA